jgi:flavin-dependent dehydrogenase
MTRRSMADILIAGGGPAGACAAIAGRMEGSYVRLIERAKTARHRVCGEFISPEASEILKTMELWDDFRKLGPHPIRRCIFHLGSHAEQWRLPECAWGLSRLRLDGLLLDKAGALGAIVSRGESLNGGVPNPPDSRLIIACGRQQTASRGDRLFGFKTHFEGPSDDAVELFFDARGYVGVSCIENGLTNVCGLAPESFLRTHAWDFDQMLLHSAPLADRLRPLRRKMRWIVTGPLSFTTSSNRGGGPNIYPAGDSMGFVDPFTGSGILNALLTGRLAGMAAARRIPASEYIKSCNAMLRGPFFISSILRRLACHSELHWLLPCLPCQALFRLTRTRSVSIRSSHLASG